MQDKLQTDSYAYLNPHPLDEDNHLEEEWINWSQTTNFQKKERLTYLSKPCGSISNGFLKSMELE